MACLKQIKLSLSVKFAHFHSIRVAFAFLKIWWKYMEYIFFILPVGPINDENGCTGSHLDLIDAHFSWSNNVVGSDYRQLLAAAKCQSIMKWRQSSTAACHVNIEIEISHFSISCSKHNLKVPRVRFWIEIDKFCDVSSE